MNKFFNTLSTHSITKNINEEVIDVIIPDVPNLQICDSNNMSSKCTIHEVIKTNDCGKKLLRYSSKICTKQIVMATNLPVNCTLKIGDYVKISTKNQHQAPYCNEIGVLTNITNDVSSNDFSNFIKCAVP